MRHNGIAKPNVNVYRVKVDPSASIIPSSSNDELLFMLLLLDGHMMLHDIFPSGRETVVE